MTDNPLVAVRSRIAALVNPYPDDSHNDGHVNHGLGMALREIDFAINAPCNLRPTAYGQWCGLHDSPVDSDRPLVDGRCGGYKHVADRVLAQEGEASR